MERLVSRTEATPSKSCETAKSTTRNCRRNRNDFRPLPSDPGRGINKYCTLLYRREELEEVAVAGSGQVLDGELTMMTMKYGELSSRDTLFSFFFFLSREQDRQCCSWRFAAIVTNSFEECDQRPGPAARWLRHPAPSRLWRYIRSLFLIAMIMIIEQGDGGGRKVIRKNGRRIRKGTEKKNRKRAEPEWNGAISWKKNVDGIKEEESEIADLVNGSGKKGKKKKEKEKGLGGGKE